MRAFLAKYALAALGVVTSLLMAVRLGRSKEKTNQAERDKKAQQKVTEAYRDSEAQFNEDVKAGKSGDARDHFG